MKFEFTFFEVPNAKSLKRRVRVTIYDEVSGARIKIDGFRIIDDGKKAPWVGLPQEKYGVGDTFKYRRLVDLNTEAKDRLLRSMIEEYKAKKH